METRVFLTYQLIYESIPMRRQNVKQASSIVV